MPNEAIAGRIFIAVVATIVDCQNKCVGAGTTVGICVFVGVGASGGIL